MVLRLRIGIYNYPIFNNHIARTGGLKTFGYALLKGNSASIKKTHTHSDFTHNHDFVNNIRFIFALIIKLYSRDNKDKTLYKVILSRINPFSAPFLLHEF